APDPEHVLLLEVGQDVRLPGAPAAAVGADTGRQLLVGVVVGVQGEAELLEVILALQAGGGLADLLDGGHEQPDQDGNNGDHHQQLDEGEPPTADTHDWPPSEGPSGKDDEGIGPAPARTGATGW